MSLPRRLRLPGKGPGMIPTLIDLLQHGGGTVEELCGKLAERFPESATEGKGGMRTTIVNQLRHLATTGRLAIGAERVEGRGTVYRARKGPGEG